MGLAIAKTTVMQTVRYAITARTLQTIASLCPPCLRVSVGGYLLLGSSEISPNFPLTPIDTRIKKPIIAAKEHETESR